jgi:hypothetical protein
MGKTSPFFRLYRTATALDCFRAAVQQICGN